MLRHGPEIPDGGGLLADCSLPIGAWVYGHGAAAARGVTAWWLHAAQRSSGPATPTACAHHRAGTSALASTSAVHVAPGSWPPTSRGRIRPGRRPRCADCQSAPDARRATASCAAVPGGMARQPERARRCRRRDCRCPDTSAITLPTRDVALLWLCVVSLATCQCTDAIGYERARPATPVHCMGPISQRKISTWLSPSTRMRHAINALVE